MFSTCAFCGCETGSCTCGHCAKVIEFYVPAWHKAKSHSESRCEPGSNFGRLIEFPLANAHPYDLDLSGTLFRGILSLSSYLRPAGEPGAVDRRVQK